MSHPQKFLVTGFCDVSGKQEGLGDITFFRPEHQYVAEHIPSQAALKEYAGTLGYWPSGKPRANSNRCEPIYNHIGDGLDYVNCPACFPNSEVTDNRIGPDA